MPPRRLVGVDAGGTFTDIVAISEEGISVGKVPSTPSCPVEAVKSAVSATLPAGEFARLVHGTTVATNALLQRTGARACLLTTAGFEDVSSIQRINRRYAFDLSWRKPAPLVRRRHTIGVRERIDSLGEIVEPLTEGEIERVLGLVDGLYSQGEIEAVALCLLFSYANPSHEIALERALVEAMPALPVSASSRVSPLWREYERMSTTVADAYVKPLMSSFLTDLSHETGGVRSGPLVVLKSNGAIGAPATIARTPVTTILSALPGAQSQARTSRRTSPSRAV